MHEHFLLSAAGRLKPLRIAVHDGSRGSSLCFLITMQNRVACSVSALYSWNKPAPVSQHMRTKRETFRASSLKRLFRCSFFTFRTTSGSRHVAALFIPLTLHILLHLSRIKPSKFYCVKAESALFSYLKFILHILFNSKHIFQNQSVPLFQDMFATTFDLIV